MAEQSGEKIHPPTAHRLKKARERGEVAQSRQLTSALALLTIAVALPWTVRSTGTRLADAMTAALVHSDAAVGEPERIGAVAGALFGQTVWAVTPLVLLMVGVAALASFLQAGPVLSVEPLTPKLERLNPVQGLKNRVFSRRAVFELFRTLLTAAAIVTLLVWLLWLSAPEILSAARATPHAGATLAASIVFRLVLLSALLLLAIGMIDLIYQRWQFRHDQRMTHQDLKRERKDTDGDPHMAAARKRRQEEIRRENAIMATQRAHVVLRNPTHLACALRFDPTKESLPRLVAKGRNRIALRMIAAAEREGVKVHTDIPLARAVYRLQDGATIPRELLEAMVAVFRQVQAEMVARGETPPWLRANDGDATGDVERR